MGKKEYLEKVKITAEEYDRFRQNEKSELVKNIYQHRNGTDIYATSRDWNLRELEIDFVLKQLESSGAGKTGGKLLDLGCGNGYSDIRIAERFSLTVHGKDFSEEMISGAKHLLTGKKILGNADFMISDPVSGEIPENYYDYALTERFLLNLPDREVQFSMIDKIRRSLKKNGHYFMIEGSSDGLEKLNKIRVKAGLPEIEDRASDNISSLKFRETELEDFLSERFTVIKKQHFGMYYLISRVVHPLLVRPETPKFDAPLNEIARTMAGIYPDFEDMGHIVCYDLQKKN